MLNPSEQLLQFNLSKARSLAQENARLVAHWRAKTRSWWDERAVYWRSLPPPGTLWREMTLTDDQLRLLQDERLVRACCTL